MNKKIFLPSIGLMALLAACSNDEMFENKPASVSNDGRPQVNLVLGAELPEMGNADTRMTGETYDDADGKKQYSWLWKESDVLGGTLFEDTKGLIHDGNYQTNYAFIRSDRGAGAGNLGAASFKTLSPVTVGSYMFYHPYNTDSEQHKLGHKLGDENHRIAKMVAGDNEGIASLGSSKDKNFFFTALNKVAIDFDEEKFEAVARELPLSFTSAYSFVRVDLTGDFKATSTTDYYKKFTVNKIELSTVATKENFVTEFTVNPQTIAAIQADMAKELEIGEVAPNGALLQDNPNLKEDIAEVRKVLRQDKYKFRNSFTLNGKSYSKDNEVSILAPVTGQTAKKLIHELETPANITSKDDHFVMWIPVPAGTYTTAKETYKFNGSTVEGTGALKLEVYTSEGKATFFVGEGSESVTLKRDQSNRVGRTLFIKDDESNIDLYAFNEKGLDVATDEEWAYAIDYIENHNYVFSNKVPQINLNGDVKVESLPTWTLQIVGNKSITLKGDFTLNPEKTILGDAKGVKVPTLVVAKGSTLNFAKEIKTLKLINNGTVNANENVEMQAMTSGEEAVLDIAAGKKVTVANAGGDVSANNVTLAENAKFTVNAGKAIVNGDMTVANEAIVTLNGTTANATNNVTLAPASTLNVAGGAYTTDGKLDIQAKGEKVSVVTVTSANTTNKGEVTVSGKLTTKAFANAMDAVLSVKAAQGEGRDASGAAVMTTLTNDGVITTEKGELTKNYFGGTINATTLNNNAKISNNGELVVKTNGANKGEITLLEDRYALIQLPNSYNNSGKIVIDTPENYCMYTYYKEWNKLEGVIGTGSIETEINSQEQYNAVLKQQNDYASESEKFTAWDVINKAYIACDLNLTKVDSKKSNYLKDVVLQGAKVTVAKNLVVNRLVADKATELTAVAANTVFTANAVDVNKDKELTINSNVKLLVRYEALNGAKSNRMMTVAGKLVNNGWIDTDNSPVAEAYKLSVLVEGELVNNGKLSQKSVKAFNVNSKEYKFVKGIYDAFNGIENETKIGKRIMMTSSKPANWNDANGIKVNAKTMKLILTEGVVTEIGKLFGNGFKGMIVSYKGKYYTFYDGSAEDVNTTVFESYVDKAAEAQKALQMKDAKATPAILMWDVVAGTAQNNSYGPTSFYIYKNAGKVDLRNSVWAYGEIEDNSKGIVEGEWSK